MTKNILDELNVRELDFLCWTHPHDDHTKGLAELFDYVTDKTAFIMSEGISNKAAGLV